MSICTKFGLQVQLESGLGVKKVPDRRNNVAAQPQPPSTTRAVPRVRDSEPEALSRAHADCPVRLNWVAFYAGGGGGGVIIA